jgi:hypothetical protein
LKRHEDAINGGDPFVDKRRKNKVASTKKKRQQRTLTARSRNINDDEESDQGSYSDGNNNANDDNNNAGDDEDDDEDDGGEDDDNDRPNDRGYRPYFHRTVPGLSAQQRKLGKVLNVILRADPNPVNPSILGMRNINTSLQQKQAAKEKAEALFRVIVQQDPSKKEAVKNTLSEINNAIRQQQQSEKPKPKYSDPDPRHHQQQQLDNARHVIWESKNINSGSNQYGRAANQTTSLAQKQAAWDSIKKILKERKQPEEQIAGEEKIVADILLQQAIKESQQDLIRDDAGNNYDNDYNSDDDPYTSMQEFLHPEGPKHKTPEAPRPKTPEASRPKTLKPSKATKKKTTHSEFVLNHVRKKVAEDARPFKERLKARVHNYANDNDNYNDNNDHQSQGDVDTEIDTELDSEQERPRSRNIAVAQAKVKEGKRLKKLARDAKKQRAAEARAAKKKQRNPTGGSLFSHQITTESNMKKVTGGGGPHKAAINPKNLFGKPTAARAKQTEAIKQNKALLREALVHKIPLEQVLADRAVKEAVVSNEQTRRKEEEEHKKIQHYNAFERLGEAWAQTIHDENKLTKDYTPQLRREARKSNYHDTGTLRKYDVSKYQEHLHHYNTLRNQLQLERNRIRNMMILHKEEAAKLRFLQPIPGQGRGSYHYDYYYIPTTGDFAEGLYPHLNPHLK